MGGVVGELTGANRAARAAEGAALEQQAEAKRTREFVTKEARRAEDITNKELDSPQQIRLMEKLLGRAEKQLDNDQRLLDAVDPALMEASNQALKLLRGERGGASTALSGQRAHLRQQLVNQLREQLGPGAETSSAGIQALTAFDRQSMDAESGLLTSLLGITQNARNQANAGFEMGQGVAGLQLNRTQTRTAPINALIGAYTNTSQPVINSAGAQFVGDQIKARSQGALFNTLLEGGLAYATGGTSMLPKLFGGGGVADGLTGSSELKLPSLGSSAGY